MADRSQAKLAVRTEADKLQLGVIGLAVTQ
jgi:hypothetical protein